MPVPLWHGKLPILGFRFGSFAYLTDCNRIPDDVVAAASRASTRSCSTRCATAAPDALHARRGGRAAAERIAPRRAYFTHMTHDLPHAATNARLPAGVELAYDGLVLDVEVDRA